jgi:hypothetical protein
MGGHRNQRLLLASTLAALVLCPARMPAWPIRQNLNIAASWNCRG